MAEGVRLPAWADEMRQVERNTYEAYQRMMAAAARNGFELVMPK